MSGAKYTYPNTVVEMRITRNVQNLWLTPSIMFADNSKRFFRIACIDALNNKWSYTIQDCMENREGLRFLSGVPTAETKVWRITKTRTHLGGGGATPVFPIFPHPQIQIFCMFNGDLWGKILKFGTKISHQYLCFKSLYCYC